MNNSEPHTASNLVDHLFRTESGKMTAILTRVFGFQNSNLVEDIVQEIFLSALKTWPVKGQPKNPSAWLMQVAKNKVVNAVKRKNRLTDWDPDLMYEVGQIDQLFLDHEIKDSQLRMMFACCLPELPRKSQIILVLKILCGFSNAEIASALLMKETAVKKAAYRAKNEIQGSYNHITVPAVAEIKKKLGTVYTVIYLIFTEGYKRSSNDDIISEDLCFEAIRLAILLLEIPGADHGKTHALLSLMYLSIARFPARVGSDGEVIELKSQDRSLWDKDCINAGFHHLRASRVSSSLSKYHLESSIASLHCSAGSFEDTNWKNILFFYRRLLQIEDSGITRLNFAIALSKVDGAEAGLQALDQVDLKSAKDKEFILYAAKAEMHAELENYEMAKSYYRVACDMAASKPDKAFLRSKIEECDRKNLSKN